MNGKPTPEFPNPVNAVQGPNPAKEKLGGCRKSPNKMAGQFINMMISTNGNSAYQDVTFICYCK